MANPRRMIAIAFGPPTMAEALEGLPRIRAEADCVELRLDLFEEAFDLQLLLRERGDLPVVITLRPPDQGGRSLLTAPERLAVLTSAAEQGAEYVDLEFDAATPAAIAQLKSAGAQIILSRHDFVDMPADGWWDDLAAQGADVVKVVGTAHDVRDCLRVLHTLERAHLPTIAIAMGEPGLLSRVLALRSEQCLLTYATLGTGASTAPGQLTAHDMRTVYRAERLGPRTMVYGLLGAHLETDRLAEYNAWFTQDNADAVAVPFVTQDDGPGIISTFAELPVDGWHVHGDELQTTVGQALDELATSACRQGKVNGIARRRDGRLVGHWVESPREQYALWRAD
jgi:3-dehydroquinate dehydratase/shikimate dehydrogenase